MGLLISDSTLFMPELENRQIEDRLLPGRVYMSGCFGDRMSGSVCERVCVCVYMYVCYLFIYFWNVGTYNSFMLTHFARLMWEHRCTLYLNKLRTGTGRHCDCTVQLSRGRLLLGYFFHALQGAGLLNVLRLVFLINYVEESPCDWFWSFSADWW